MSRGREEVTKEARDKKEGGLRGLYLYLSVPILSLDKRKLFDLSRIHPCKKKQVTQDLS